MTDLSNEPTGLYKIWKIEKEVWLKGHIAMEKYVLPEAVIIPPYPMPPQRLEVLLEASKRAQPFQELEISEQQFLNLGSTVLITYFASAKHKRFRNRYLARCKTTYVRMAGLYKIAGHAHIRLPKDAYKPSI